MGPKRCHHDTRKDSCAECNGPMQAERQLRGVQPLPSREGENLLQEVQPLPPRQAEKELRGLQVSTRGSGKLKEEL